MSLTERIRSLLLTNYDPEELADSAVLVINEMCDEDLCKMVSRLPVDQAQHLYSYLYERFGE